MVSHDEAECWFSQLCKGSVSAKHWIKNFIKPLFLMLLYVSAEKEGEFGLHLYAWQQMMAYLLLQSILTTLDIGCVALTPWRDLQMKPLNLS